ncbi:ubiquinol-cytochrome c reductase iron-sulfur subunit [Actimicrobium sp. CCI2.3]|uniref:ubiquinol-cytochrome c reductase iron-sulfur subunit n=1 Tax=Actimicrobium sp. CCI2.3 TaxID=3048616 RepID=UPI002AB41624|nr:ubiquinol-cytochrome c reductase iron-sulfur subunit [Actimicrobium sp. CCI2.3]MDY7573387.1 ubiquinol-cytochrome c reductase iron-sulfur subunit [Actimicrobium sp. CCI2.3]MEB0021785.1 ubiquinol-cytochrome c reductase iron-sulfur subunit [Actimicrobium sp. CCI2.3]
MSNEKQVDSGRRGLLVATCAAGGVAGLATAGALVSTFAPSERAKAAGASVEVDIAGLAPGEMRTVEWRGKPVWILKRTPEMMASLKDTKTDAELADPNSERNKDELTPEYARNEFRSIKPEILVAVGICSHLGCSPGTKFQTGPQPSLPDDWHGGFLCPCHGSTFDLAGRVYKNKPAPDNLQVPRHMFLGDGKIVIGKDEKGEA